MGKADSDAGHQSRGKRKNKARMNYLKQTRQEGGRSQGGSGGGGWNRPGQGTVDEHGYKSGDYVSAYRGRGRGGGRGQGRFNSNKRRPKHELSPGMKGFICTTNFRESDCVREAYNLLNEFDDANKHSQAAAGVSTTTGGDRSQEDQMESDTGNGNVIVETEMESSTSFGVVKEGAAAVAEVVVEKEASPIAKSGNEEIMDTEVAKNEDEDEESDIEESLKKEIKELKSDRVARRFQCVDTGVKNVIFISSTVDDPNQLVCKIFDDVVSKQEARARYILRFLPVEGSCQADFPNIRKLCKDILEKYFKDGYKSFKVMVNVRLNSKLEKERDEIIKILAEVVNEVNPLNFVDLKTPTFIIIAEVLKTVCCISVVKDFVKNRKYNLMEAANPTPADAKPTSESKPVETKDENINTAEIPAVVEQEEEASTKVDIEKPEKTELENVSAAATTATDADN